MIETTKKETELMTAIATITRIFNSLKIYSSSSFGGTKVSFPWIDFRQPNKPKFRFIGEENVMIQTLKKFNISEERFNNNEHTEAQAYYDYLLYSKTLQKTQEYKQWEIINTKNGREFISWFLSWRSSYKSYNTLTALTFRQIGGSIRLQPFWSTIPKDDFFPVFKNSDMFKEVEEEFKAFAEFMKAIS